MKDIYKLEIFKELLNQFCGEEKKKKFREFYPNFPEGIDISYGMGEVADVHTIIEDIMIKLQLDDEISFKIKTIISAFPGEVEQKNNTLMTDLYELTMSDIYYNGGMKDWTGYFDLFHRRNVFNGGYQISAGLEEAIEYIKNFHFSEEDIEYLRNTGKFNDNFLEYLKNLRFTGNVWAVPDGTPIFSNEPNMTIEAPIIEGQILETALLTAFNSGSLAATAAKRITEVAGNRPVAEFGARRVRGGLDATLVESKYAYMGGCSATSNTLAGKLYDIPVTGTIAHALVQAFDDEYEAFLTYAKEAPDKNKLTLLVDTYDTIGGILNAIRLQKEYLDPLGCKLAGIRIDSGDLVYLTKEARRMFKEAGMDYVQICVSNGLDVDSLQDLLNRGAEIDTLGIGDNIVAPRERADHVYKLVAVKKERDGEITSRIKVSGETAKTINPGFKKVVRFYDKDTNQVLGDAITLRGEEIDEEHYTLVDHNNTWKKTELQNYTVRNLQVPIFVNGELVYDVPSLKLRRDYTNEEFKTLTERITDPMNPHTYYVDLSEDLRNLKEEMLHNATLEVEERKQAYQKKMGERK